MDSSSIPYNMTFSFGEHLREIPSDKMEMLQGMLYLREQLKGESLSTHTKIKLNGLLGDYLRIIGELEESRRYLNTAIQLAEKENDQHTAFVNKLRLAQTFQWENQFDISNKMFAALLKQAETDPSYAVYLDYAYDYYAKNLFDQQEYQEALAYFQKALAIRSENGNANLIDVTKKAIAACEKHSKT